MVANSVTTHETTDQGVPLDLGPLLAPYLQHGPLSIRIEQMPQLARLSKGRNNGDCTFSLKPDDVPGLAYLPAAGSDRSEITLAVRIINLDDDYATTLALIDLPVSPVSKSEKASKRKFRVVETPEDFDNQAGEQFEEAAALQAVHVKREDRVKTEADGAREEARKKLESEIAQLRQQLDTKASDAEDFRDQALEADEAAQARYFVEQLAAAKEELEQGFTERLTKAQRRAEEDAAARIAAAEKKAEEADRAGARAQKDFEDKLSQLQQQRDAINIDAEEVNRQALEAAESTHARAFVEQVAATKRQLEKEFEDRLAAAQQNWQADADADLSAAREQWNVGEAERLAATKKEFDAEVSQLRQQQDADAAATVDIEEVRKQAIEIAETAHARDLEERLVSTQQQLEADFTDRLAEALRQAEKKVSKRIASAEKKAEKAAALQADYAARVKEAKSEASHAKTEAMNAFKEQLSDLRQQLEAAAFSAEDAGQQAVEAVKTAHAQQINELHDAHTRALEAKVTATTEQLEREYTDRLAQTLRRAEEKAEAHQTQARQAWETEAEINLSSARETWRAEEAERLAATRKEFEGEISQQRQQQDGVTVDIEAARKQTIEAAEAAHADEIATLQITQARALVEQADATEKRLEREFEDNLAKALRQAEEETEARQAAARQTWQADADAALSSAHETWKAEEAERRAAATKEYEDELSDLRQQRDAGAADTAKGSVSDAQANVAAEQPAQEITDRLAEPLRQAEEKFEARLKKARQTWEADAQAALSAAHGTWKTEEAERLAAAKQVWQGHAGSGNNRPSAREMAYRHQRNWRPRRSVVVAIASVCLFVLPPLHPEVRSVVADRVALAVTELRTQIDTLVVGEPVLVQPSQPDISTVVENPPIVVDQRTTVEVESANVRGGPSTDASVIKSLPRGSEVTLLGSENSWLLVRFGDGADGVGWVHSDLLSDDRRSGGTTP